MPRKKSTDTPQRPAVSPQVKALRKLLLTLGLSTVTANRLITQMEGHHADLSAKACEIEMYIAAHPEVKRPRDYAARTLMNYVDEQTAAPSRPVYGGTAAVSTVPGGSPVSPLSGGSPVSLRVSGGSPAAIPHVPAKMDLWGDEEV